MQHAGFIHCRAYIRLDMRHGNLSVLSLELIDDRLSADLVISAGVLNGSGEEEDGDDLAGVESLTDLGEVAVGVAVLTNAEDDLVGILIEHGDGGAVLGDESNLVGELAGLEGPHGSRGRSRLNDLVAVQDIDTSDRALSGTVLTGLSSGLVLDLHAQKIKSKALRETRVSEVKIYRTLQQHMLHAATAPNSDHDIHAPTARNTHLRTSVSRVPDPELPQKMGLKGNI